MADQVPLKLVPAAGAAPNTIQRFQTGDTLNPAVVGLTGAVVGTTDTQTLTNKVLVNPDINSVFHNSSPASSLDFVGVGSAVNKFAVQNNIAGQSPRLSATGTDANINVVLNTKGTGVVQARYGGVVFQVATLTGNETLTNKGLTTPTIGDFTNANHTHQNAAGGGLLTSAAFALGSGVHRNILCSSIVSTAIVNTAVATSFDNAKVSSTFNAMLGALGATLRLTYCGRFSNAGTPNLTLSLRDTTFGTTFATSGAIVTPAGVANELWSVTFLVNCQAIGALGSIVTTCPQEIIAGTSRARVVSTTTAFNFVANGATTTAFGLWAQWGTAAVANTIVCDQAIIEALT